jgi:hypothetical protein
VCLYLVGPLAVSEVVPVPIWGGKSWRATEYYVGVGMVPRDKADGIPSALN